MSGTHQEDTIFVVVNIDTALEAIPTTVEACLLAVPDGVNYQVELLSVNYTAVVLPVDGTDPVTFDLEWVDDSNGDAVANLVAAFDLEGGTARVNNQVWRGSQILDPGDTVNAEFAVTTPDTSSQGAALVVEYRVLRRS